MLILHPGGSVSGPLLGDCPPCDSRGTVPLCSYHRRRDQTRADRRRRGAPRVSDPRPWGRPPGRGPECDRTDRRRPARHHAHARARARGLHRRRTKSDPSRYDPDQAFKVALPHLVKVRELGCAIRARVHTGLHRARRQAAPAPGRRIRPAHPHQYRLLRCGERQVPAASRVHGERRQLAARWIREAEHGIDGTPIRPGFMKIGVDEAPLSDVDAKLVRAAAIAHSATGLTIASHTTTGAAAMAEIELLDRAGVSAERVHLGPRPQRARRVIPHTRRESWRLGGVRRRGRDSIGRHVELVRHMKAGGPARARAAVTRRRLVSRRRAGRRRVSAVHDAVHRPDSRARGRWRDEGRDQADPRREPAAGVDRRITVTLSSRAARSERPADRPR